MIHKNNGDFMKLDDFLVCPKCKKKVERNEQYYQCLICQTNYPIIHDIPVFITGDIEAEKRKQFWNEGWQYRVERGDVNYLKESKGKIMDILKKSLENFKQSKHIFTETLSAIDKIILNIGCGTGEAIMFTYIGAKKYIGVDFSFNAAKYSYETINKLGGEGITVNADAESLPIESGTIDLVYSNGVLHHTPETQKTLDEVFRVLKPGGTGIIGLYVTYSPHFILDHIIGIFKSIMNKNYKYWYNNGESAWKTGNLVNQWTKTYTKKELLNMLSKYELKDLKIRKNGFDWANTIFFLGKYMDHTAIGKWSARYLDIMLGDMWIITFRKVNN